MGFDLKKNKTKKKSLFFLVFTTEIEKGHFTVTEELQVHVLLFSR